MRVKSRGEEKVVGRYPGILTDKVQKFQVYQDQPGVIKFTAQCGAPIEDELKQKLISAMNKFFNKVSYFEKKYIPPESNGKYKYIVNAIKK